MIPVNTPLLDGNEGRYLQECITGGWISSDGPFVARFEEAFSRRVGCEHGVSVCNGTAALELAVAALHIGPGDEVILPSLTIISCAAAIARAGATPVPVDVDPTTWNVDPQRVEEAITPRTKAILVVHLYGLPCDMARIGEIARRHRLHVIEDAAQAHGQSFAGRLCGSLGDIATFSFYPNKHVTTGEGGMVVTNNPMLAERCRSLRNLCFQPERRFVHEELGWNYRLSNLQAAVGLAQLEQLDRFLAIKQRMGRRYREILGGDDRLILAPEKTPHADNHYWVFAVVLADAVPVDAGEAMARLAAKGVGTRPFFWPIHQQPVFLRQGRFTGLHLPHSEKLARRGFYLPSGLALSDEDLETSARTLLEVLA